jgi:hypothetical protein
MSCFYVFFIEQFNASQISKRPKYLVEIKVFEIYIEMNGTSAKLKSK